MAVERVPCCPRIGGLVPFRCKAQTRAFPSCVWQRILVKCTPPFRVSRRVPLCSPQDIAVARSHCTPVHHFP